MFFTAYLGGGDSEVLIYKANGRHSIKRHGIFG